MWIRAFRQRTLVRHNNVQPVTTDEFEQFARALLPGLARYATGLVGAADAEDICQATLITLWGKKLKVADSRAEQRQQYALAYRIADSHMANLRRSRDRRRGLLRRHQSQLKANLETDSSAHTSADETEAYLALLALVDEPDREVLALIVAGFALSEISEILDCSLSAAKMRAHRARKRLRAALGSNQTEEQYEQ